MSVEIPEATESYEVGDKPVNGQQVVDQRLNGISNGHVEDDKHKSKHKSSSKDKYRDKDRDKDHKSSSKSGSSRDKETSDRHKSSSSSKDKYKDKERDRDKDKSKSSSHKSSSRDKDKDKEREKDKERSKDKDKERDKERSKEKDKERDRDRDRDREREKDKDRHRDKDRDKNKDRENDKEKDRKKDHKSSSSSSHGKERSKESSNKDRDKEKDRDKYKSSSSSSKDKHSSSSSSKSKDKDKDKYSSSRDKEKDRSRDKDKEKDRKDKIKEEIQTNGVKQEEFVVKEEPIVKNETHHFFKNDNEKQIDYKEPKREFGTTEYKEDRINSSQASSCDYSMSQFRDDEPAFIIKNERQEDSDFNIEDSRTQMDFTQNDDSQNGDSQNEDSQNAFNESDIKMEQNESDDEDDVPLAKRKVQMMDQSDDDVPLISRKKAKTTKKDKDKGKKLKKKRGAPEEDEEEDEKPRKKKVKKEKVEEQSPTKGRKKKEEEPEDVWRWWEEEKREDGVKWNFLEHKGPLFAPLYERLPDHVKFYYDGKQMKLTQDAEEIACFYAKMLNHDYVTKKAFNENFFKDWRKSMSSKEKETIRELRKCNFKEINQYFDVLSEKKKNKSKEEKLAIKEENEKLIQEYGFCTIDGHKERIGNFKIEPPGLFRGRGEHPKMGMVKRRVLPEDVFINCSKDSKIPVPPAGHKWREVRHDNSVTWLASWTENVQGQVKYVMLNPSSKLKGEKDYQKYEVARRLQKHIDEIRATYRDEWKSKEMRIRQRGVALYFIDKLALRAGNEKDEDQADTVGCCSLRVEHIALHKELNGKENVVVFDFLGKDSIRYYNEVEVEKRVFKNLELFMENKKEGDDLFDRLNTSILNEHLRDIMEGLTAKVFRTYNASSTLQKQLELLTDPNMSLPEKLLAYNRANRAVAILCNHQRAVPKSHAKSMENLKEKIRLKREQLDEAEAECDDLERVSKRGSVKEKIMYDKKKKQVEKLRDQVKKLELQETDKDENKTIALSTSKLNYLDPRISVAWCKKFDVPIDKIYNKTQRDKFRWAIHMATEDFYF